MGIRSYPYGGTYNTSDNFPSQKNNFQNSVALHYIPPFRRCPPDLSEPIADSDPTTLPLYKNRVRM